MTRRVFFTCWLFYTVFWTPFVLREHFPALALAEEGTLNVHRYIGWTDDIFAGPRGGAYINNNPGASLAGAVPLILLRPILIAAAEEEVVHASRIRILPEQLCQPARAVAST